MSEPTDYERGLRDGVEIGKQHGKPAVWFFAGFAGTFAGIGAWLLVGLLMMVTA